MQHPPEATRLTPEAIPPAEIAGIPTERLRPMRDGSVTEYDRPVFTEVEGVGRYSDPEKQPVHVHPPGSEVAEALRPVVEAREAIRRTPRPATARDAHQDDELAILHRLRERQARERGDHDEADREATQARRRTRRAWMIRRHLNAAKTRPPALPTAVAAPTTRTRARGAGRPAARRAAGSRSGSDPGGEDGSSDGAGSPGPVPFEEFQRALARYSPRFRCLVDAHGSEASAGGWRLLGLEAQDRADAYTYQPLDPEPTKRRSPHHGTPTSTSTGSAAVEFDHDDPLKRIPASEYLPVIAGVEVSSSGRCRCPMPDHEDVHPSAKAYGTRWKCFSCGAKSTIIDVAAAVYGLGTTGPDYLLLRDRIVEAFLWAPTGREGER